MANRAIGPQLAALIEQGDIRFEYHHRIVLGPDSLRAAVASECAADQGQFWDYHDQLFKSSQGRGGANVTTLKSIAAQLGLDTNTFRQCLDSADHEPYVISRDKQSQFIGVTGTPTFFLNGRQLEIKNSFGEVLLAVKAALQL